MAHHTRVLLLDEAKIIPSHLGSLLETDGYQVRAAWEQEQALELVAREDFAVLLLAPAPADSSHSLETLRLARRRQAACAGILLASQLDLQTALAALHQRVFACLVSPTPVEELKRQVILAAEQCRRDQSLHHHQHLFGLLFDASPHPVLIQDLQNRSIHLNAAFRRVFGYQRIDLEDPSHPFVPPWDHHRTHQDLLRLYAGEGVPERDTQRLTKDGRPLEVTLNLALRRDERGNPREVVWVLRDNSRLARLEKQIRQVKKMAALGEMAGSIAHDFNNFLTSITCFAQLALTKTPPEDPHRHYLHKITRLGEHASHMTRRLLDFSRRHQADAKPIPLVPVVREALEALRAGLPPGIRLQQRLEPGGTVAAESGQIHQIVTNLCRNAVQAMPSGGWLRVELGPVEVDQKTAGGIPGLKPGPHLRLRVQDSGQGMEPWMLKRVFEPFFTTKPAGKGTGLGLALVQGMVQELGGAVRVESRPGHGSEFQVWFPCLPDVPVVASGSSRRGLAGQKLILFVDQDPHILELARLILTRHGYEVETHQQGRQALESFQDHPERVGLLVSELEVPGGRQPQLISQVLQQRPGLPIILTVGFPAELARRQARKMGIRTVVVKPYHFSRDMLPAVKRLMGPGERAEKCNQAADEPTPQEAGERNRPSWRQESQTPKQGDEAMGRQVRR